MINVNEIFLENENIKKEDQLSQADKLTMILSIKKIVYSNNYYQQLSNYDEIFF